MTYVQVTAGLPIHSCVPKNYVSLANELQKHKSKENRNHGVTDKVKYRERFNKIKWTDRQYHVQDNAYVAHKYLKMYCDTNQFPSLLFCGSHIKPRGARGLGKH